MNDESAKNPILEELSVLSADELAIDSVTSVMIGSDSEDLAAVELALSSSWNTGATWYSDSSNWGPWN